MIFQLTNSDLCSRIDSYFMNQVEINFDKNESSDSDSEPGGWDESDSELKDDLDNLESEKITNNNDIKLFEISRLYN